MDVTEDQQPNLSPEISHRIYAGNNRRISLFSWVSAEAHWACEAGHSGSLSALVYDKDPFPFFFFLLLSVFLSSRLAASTGPPAAAVSPPPLPPSVLRPAGVGGRPAFVAVEESGRDDQNGPHEEHAVDDSRRHMRKGRQKTKRPRGDRRGWGRAGAALYPVGSKSCSRK